jgi:hypothetical protein
MLVPEDVCQRAIQAATSEITGTSDVDTASAASKRIIAQYPKRGKEDFHDAATYARALTALLAEFPPVIVMQACKEIPRRARWLPSIADVQAVLSELVARRRLVIVGAERQLAEHKRRRDEDERAALVERDREKVQAGLKDLMASLAAAVQPPEADAAE